MIFKVFAIVLAFSLGVAVGGQPIIWYNYGLKKYDQVCKLQICVLVSNHSFTDGKVI